MESGYSGRGEKESIVYFSDEVRDVLETYLDERQAIDALPGHEDAVFLSLQKKKDERQNGGKYRKKICGSCYSPEKNHPP